MSRPIHVSDNRRWSFVIVEGPFVTDIMPKLSGNAVKVYLALLNRARMTGNCFPKLSTIAEDIGGASEQSVRNWIKELVEVKLVEVDQKFRANGSRSTNLYSILAADPKMAGGPGPQRDLGTSNKNSFSKEKEVVSKSGKDRATAEEIADMRIILNTLSDENNQQYGGTTAYKLTGPLVGQMKPLLRQYGKDVMIDACRGWRNDSWAVEKRLSYPQHIFKFIEKYAPLANKQKAAPRWKRLD